MMTLGQKRTRKYGSLIVTEEMKTDLTKDPKWNNLCKRNSKESYVCVETGMTKNSSKLLFFNSYSLPHRKGQIIAKGLQNCANWGRAQEQLIASYHLVGRIFYIIKGWSKTGPPIFKKNRWGHLILF